MSHNGLFIYIEIFEYNIEHLIILHFQFWIFII